MQNVHILAFRKRLKKRGYTNISIKKKKDSDLYIVSAVEPLAKVDIVTSYSIYDMSKSFRF